MEKIEMKNLFLIPMDESECISVRGGDGGWDHEIVKYVGFGIGYGAKKFVMALRFMSRQLYESQSRSMVVYK